MGECNDVNGMGNNSYDGGRHSEAVYKMQNLKKIIKEILYSIIIYKVKVKLFPCVIN
jgi:hypothetical protein